MIKYVFLVNIGVEKVRVSWGNGWIEDLQDRGKARFVRNLGGSTACESTLRAVYPWVFMDVKSTFIFITVSVVFQDEVKQTNRQRKQIFFFFWYPVTKTKLKHKACLIYTIRPLKICVYKYIYWRDSISFHCQISDYIINWGYLDQINN